MATTRVGRPPVREISDALIAAAVRLMSADGSASLTVESVTTEAGTTRPSFYRRFPSIAHLQMEVIELELPIPSIAPTGDLVTDLARIDGAVYAVCESHYLRHHGSSLVFLALTDPILAERWNAHFRDAFHAQISAALHAGIPQLSPGSGELCAQYLSDVMVTAPLMDAILSNGERVGCREHRGDILSEIAHLIAAQPV